MGWSIGYDRQWDRDIGYAVPAVCDQPKCNEEINRGLSYVCGQEPYGGDRGCGLYFCEEHLLYSARLPILCARCIRSRPSYKAKPDVREWIKWKLTDESWATWRKENPDEVKKLELTEGV